MGTYHAKIWRRVEARPGSSAQEATPLVAGSPDALCGSPSRLLVSRDLVTCSRCIALMSGRPVTDGDVLRIDDGSALDPADPAVGGLEP